MKLKVDIKCLAACLIALSTLAFSFDASALPAFARKNHMQCSSCHTAYPTLTPLGRNFKETGYRFTGSDMGRTKVSKNLQFDTNFPMSLALISRPYSDSKNGTNEIRAIHEGELYAGGEIYKNISGFLEMEAEGEDGFALALSSASITYNHNTAANLQIGYGPSLMADPYDTYADMRRLTSKHYELFNRKDSNADNNDKLRHSRQQVAFYGRASNLFYYGGVGGLTEDKTGSDSSIYFGRVSYDISPQMMIGAMTIKGQCKTTDCTAATSTRDFTRYAIDGQFDIDNVRLTGVFMKTKDDSNAGVEQTNNHYYIQAFYTFTNHSRPTWVPLLRLESYEENNGVDQYSLATATVSYYFEENVKGQVEYQTTYDTPTGVATDNNVTVQLEVVF